MQIKTTFATISRKSTILKVQKLGVVARDPVVRNRFTGFINIEFKGLTQLEAAKKAGYSRTDIDPLA